jgi:hypothetical protein
LGLPSLIKLSARASVAYYFFPALFLGLQILPDPGPDFITVILDNVFKISKRFEIFFSGLGPFGSQIVMERGSYAAFVAQGYVARPSFLGFGQAQRAKAWSFFGWLSVISLFALPVVRLFGQECFFSGVPKLRCTHKRTWRG